jgi:DNA-binding HxlR family transcriptional regulator
MESADSVALVVWAKALRGVRNKLKRISEKVLTDQLRQLQADGVLTRHASGRVPPQVTYSLSADGQKLVPMMELLCDWGSAHFGIKPSLPRRPRHAEHYSL